MGQSSALLSSPLGIVTTVDVGTSSPTLNTKFTQISVVVHRRSVCSELYNGGGGKSKKTKGAWICRN